MYRPAILLPLALCTLVIAACSDPGGTTVDKATARSTPLADWPEDWCETQGWYGDGECDIFCPLADDLDCPASECDNANPCPTGETCDIQSCSGSGGGICVPEPQACIQIYAPVCGCDGVTYGNDCDRLAAGVGKEHDGACVQPGTECGGIAGVQCPSGQICDIQVCDLDAQGTCVPDHDACIEIYAPVCGCDGVTYSNDCERVGAGAALSHEGPCEDPGLSCGGIGGIPCPSGQVCDYRQCPFDDAPGTCVPEPQACTAIYAPVCGCDGITYANDCERLAAGAALFAEGPCEPGGDTCGGLMGTPCPSGEVCDIRICAMDAGGTCVAQPDGCIEIYDPVCSCDGQTYANDCERVAAGAALSFEGPCMLD